MKLIIYTDGASRGNPGNSAIAYRIESSGKLLEEQGEFIGVATNNEAEYKALIRALKEAVKYSPDEVHCISDSKLLISQVKGEWKINKEQLRKYYNEVKALEVKKTTYEHVNRDNPGVARCDALANEALDNT